MSEKSSTLAVFDFDGTITKCDSLLPFLWTATGGTNFLLKLGWLVIWVAAFKLGILTRQRAKEKVLTQFFKGMEREKLIELGAAFARTRLVSLVREHALLCLRKHLASGDRVLIISASPDFYIISWANSLGSIEVHSTRLAFDGSDRFTGHILGKNCYGAEKVARLTSAVPNFADYNLIVYGDSEGDRDLYQIADEYHHRFF